MAFIPNNNLIVYVRLSNDMSTIMGYLQQYGNQYFSYAGDTTSTDYTNLQTFVKFLYSSSEVQADITSMVTGASILSSMKQFVINLDQFIGDQKWPATHSNNPNPIVPRTGIDGMQLLSALSLKVKYLKQYLTQLATIDPTVSQSSYNSTLLLCKNIYSYPAQDISTTAIDETSGVKQILYVLDNFLGQGVWPPS